MKLEHSGGVKAMSDEQIEETIEAIQTMLAARAGEAAKVSEGAAEPAALPAPGGHSPEKLSSKSKPNRLMKEVDRQRTPRTDGELDPRQGSHFPYRGPTARNS